MTTIDRLSPLWDSIFPFCHLPGSDRPPQLAGKLYVRRGPSYSTMTIAIFIYPGSRSQSEGSCDTDSGLFFIRHRNGPACPRLAASRHPLHFLTHPPHAEGTPSPRGAGSGEPPSKSLPDLVFPRLGGCQPRWPSPHRPLRIPPVATPSGSILKGRMVTSSRREKPKAA